jgi:hypothetical protein
MASERVSTPGRYAENRDVKRDTQRNLRTICYIAICEFRIASCSIGAQAS